MAEDAITVLAHSGIKNGSLASRIPIRQAIPTYFESRGFFHMDLFVVSRGELGSVLEYDCIIARLGKRPV